MSRKSNGSVYNNGVIECVCGNRITASLEEDLTFDAGTHSESLEDSEEYECEDCGRTFKLSVGVTCITDFVELEEQETKVRVANGEVVPVSELTLGTEINLADGEYMTGTIGYAVRDGRLESRWSESITDDQQKLAI